MFNIPSTIRKSIQVLSIFFILVAMLPLSGGQADTPTPTPPIEIPSTQGAAAQPESQPTSTALQQFTVGGYVLGVQDDGFLITGVDHMLKTNFVGARAVHPSMESSQAQTDEQQKAPPLGKLSYAELWEGVSLTVESDKQGALKIGYQIAPGAKVEQVRLRFNRTPELSADGGLLFRFEKNELRLAAPQAWQQVQSEKQAVTAAYKLIDGGEVTLEIGEHDPNQTMAVEGDLLWNTFLGGASTDRGKNITLDANGNVYITGESELSWGTPLRAYSGLVDAFVAKLDSSGTLLWNTFLGGIDYDSGSGIAMDSSGNAYISGSSSATWGAPLRPISPGSDVFVVKLDSSGTLLWNTFLGGLDYDSGSGIAVDGSGNAYVCGNSYASWGTPLRPFSGGSDALVAKLDSSGTLLWNTFLGGIDYDSGSGIALDSSGNAFITGISSATWGTPLRPISPGSDVFVVKLDSSGTLLWNTFLGGNSVSGIAMDSSGNAYITGSSSAAWGAPLRPFSGGYDAFVAKLDSSGTLLWNTFLGGFDYDRSSGIAVDGSGNAYISGSSSATWGAPLRPFSKGDAFVAKLGSSGNLLWNTFLGGNSSDFGSAIAVDSSGNTFVSGNSRDTWGSPVRPFSGGYDAFTAKLSNNGNLLWNTFLGGIMTNLIHGGAGGPMADDIGFSIATDSNGNTFMTGFSAASWGTPIRPHSGFNDTFVAKLDSDGNLLWNTFLGGLDYPSGSAIAVDGSGNAYITGINSATWGSPLRPFSNKGDAFVVKLESTGTLLWNTFLGGIDYDSGSGIAMDSSGNAYISGSSSATWGAPLRPFSGASNAFVAKLDSSGTLLWNTFLGGIDYDRSSGIAVDGSGNAYISGRSSATWGTPLRPISTGYDAFVAKLDSSGTLLWNTFLGGDKSDSDSGIAVDGSGNAYISGSSSATWGAPLRPFSGASNAFVAKLDSSGTLLWNTFLGGLDYDYGNGIVVDGSGNAFVTGSSSATWGTPLRPISSWLDAFVAKLGSSGTLLWNTFLGGNSSDDGSGIAVDSSGNAYVCGYSSNTWGIPVRPFSGIDDAFVAKLSSNAPPTYTTSGKVTDKDGKVVPNVTFTTNTGQSATTNASGDYRLTDLAAGTYTITPSSSVIGVTFNPSSLTITVPPSATGKNFLLLPLSNCSNIIKNGEFETDTDWYLPITRFPAGMKSPVGYDVELAEAAAANYSTDEVHGGTRSLRTGIVDAVMNTYSYSSGWQQVTISTSIVSANLRFWYFPRSLGGIDGHDVQLMLFLNNGKQEITRPLNTRSDEQIWKYLDVDMKSYAGQTLWVYFGTLNDGYNSVMAMYVDDVTLDVCK